MTFFTNMITKIMIIRIMPIAFFLISLFILHNPNAIYWSDNVLLLSTANLLICSKPYNRRTLSTAPFSNIHSSFDLDPYFITGFADGESCFSFQFFKNNRLTVGREVRPSFSIHRRASFAAATQKRSNIVKTNSIFFLPV